MKKCYTRVYWQFLENEEDVITSSSTQEVVFEIDEFLGNE